MAPPSTWCVEGKKVNLDSGGTTLADAKKTKEKKEEPPSADKMQTELSKGFSTKN